MQAIPPYHGLTQSHTHLHQVPKVLPACGKVEVAQEGQSVLPGASNLQVVGSTHIAEVCSVAGCNRRTDTEIDTTMEV